MSDKTVHCNSSQYMGITLAVVLTFGATLGFLLGKLQIWYGIELPNGFWGSALQGFLSGYLGVQLNNKVFAYLYKKQEIYGGQFLRTINKIGWCCIAVWAIVIYFIITKYS
ncbi:MAG: hypothetical protein Q4B88_05370 [Moraxella sp.]|nr:hypothetical protein [Moraxella sp.]